jgi:uncharacterized membrane protein YbhN (UPF0104 family)
MDNQSGALPDARPSRSRVVLLGLLQLACVGLVARLLWNDRHELASMPSMAARDFVLLFGLNLLGHLQRTLEFTYMLRRLGVREPFGEGFLLTGAGYLLNHLPLNAGFVMRAVILRRDHALPYSSYVSLTMVNAVLNLGVGAVVSAIVVGASGSGGSSRSALLVGLVALTLVCALTLYLPALPLPGRAGWLRRQFLNLAEGVRMIRGSGGALLLLSFLALAKVFTLALRFAICFHVLGRPIPVRAAVLVAVAHNLLAIVNFTPGNLGLRELVISVLAGELGSSQPIGLAAASVERVVSLVYIVLTGLPGIHSLRNRGRAALPG